jgi:hypothetical protein
MATPSSGEISISEIANETGLALTNISLRNLSQIAGFSTPDAMSDFYSYSQTDAQRYINAVNNAGTALTSTEETAIADLIDGMVIKNIWDHVIGFYPMLGGNAAQQRINAKSVDGVRQSAYDIFFFGGWSYNTTIGATGNASNTYYAIDYDYSYASLDYSHFGVYQTLPSFYGGNYGLDIAIYDGSGNAYVGMTNNDQNSKNGGYSWDIQGSGLIPFGTTADPASMLMVYDNSTSPNSLYYENGALYYDTNSSIGSLSTSFVGGGYWAGSGYTDRTYGFITFGGVLDSTQAFFYQLYINDFQNTLGRSIY